jgi:hypothetical protein
MIGAFYDREARFFGTSFVTPGYPLLNSLAFAPCFPVTDGTMRIELDYFMAKTSKSNKYVYTWGNKKADGDGSMKALLGGKGANLAEMTRIGLPVPPGFTITTEVCTYYYAHKNCRSRWKRESPTWKKSWAASSAMRRACRSWWPSVLARGTPCPA